MCCKAVRHLDPMDNNMSNGHTDVDIGNSACWYRSGGFASITEGHRFLGRAVVHAKGHSAQYYVLS